MRCFYLNVFCNNISFLFSCERALRLVQENIDLRKKWSSAVEWLSDELERVIGL